MICVSIAESDLEGCLKAMHGLEMAEIRLDKLNEPKDEIVKKIFTQPLKLIATCRPEAGDDERRKKILFTAIDNGAAFVDIEVDCRDDYKKAIVERAKKKDCKVIISFHDHKKTPPSAELEQIVDWCFQSGADIAKIACMVNSNKDNAKLLGLLDSERNMVVIGMGVKGRITRVIAPLLGSVFTFAASEKGKETADGQLTKNEIEQLMQQIDVIK
ncbi:MAG: type I 3-dehydroquinate dehydratase [Candidatus Micrarchaeota archaeon]